MTDDIVARLRNCDCIPHCLCGEAADEIERLRRGGCARDQRTTQYCAEAVSLQNQLDNMKARLEAQTCVIRTLEARLKEHE